MSSRTGRPLLWRVDAQSDKPERARVVPHDVLRPARPVVIHDEADENGEMINAIWKSNTRQLRCLGWREAPAPPTLPSPPTPIQTPRRSDLRPWLARLTLSASRMSKTARRTIGGSAEPSPTCCQPSLPSSPLRRSSMAFPPPTSPGTVAFPTSPGTAIPSRSTARSAQASSTERAPFGRPSTRASGHSTQRYLPTSLFLCFPTEREEQASALTAWFLT